MRSRMVHTNGVTLRVMEAGDPGAPLVVLCHGFPELAFSWRHQVAALAEAGYHVLAPDQRGYGGSDRPEDVDAYNVRELSADMVGLIDDVGADRAALIGHDFGSVVAWGAALLRDGCRHGSGMPRCRAFTQPGIALASIPLAGPSCAWKAPAKRHRLPC